jgi:O-antigen/teichoic acid export membrane protein
VTLAIRVRLVRDRVLMGNIAARVAALASLVAATFVLARTEGPAGVGIYSLLRVLPSLLGVIAAAGLPGAIPYFLAARRSDGRHLPATIVSIALAGGVLGALVWAVASPVVGGRLFAGLPLGLLLLAGLMVITQVVLVTAKASSQGSDDLPGSNRVIVMEQFMFLPVYGALWVGGVHGYTAVIVGALLADVVTCSLAWGRLVRRGFFASAGRPSLRLARAIAAYGLRAQVGGVMSLLNLRLDFVLLSLLAGPAVLGVYAIASKFAELVKIPTMALTYVLYPRYAKDEGNEARAGARNLMPKAALLSAGMVLVLWLSAGLVIPWIYGADFAGAVRPAQIILAGLVFEGVAAVVTGYLYGSGRPGLNSIAMAAGLVVTVALDLLLIPPFEAVGAAVASAVAYTTATLVLVSFFWRVSPSRSRAAWETERGVVGARS